MHLVWYHLSIRLHSPGLWSCLTHNYLVGSHRFSKKQGRLNWTYFYRSNDFSWSIFLSISRSPLHKLFSSLGPYAVFSYCRQLKNGLASCNWELQHPFALRFNMYQPYQRYKDEHSKVRWPWGFYIDESRTPSERSWPCQETRWSIPMDKHRIFMTATRH